MGKKKNKKFKKTAGHSEATTKNITRSMTATENEVSEIDSSETNVPIGKVDLMGELDHKYTYVRRDVKKLGIAITTLAILMIVIYFTNQKTGFLGTIGNWIYKVGNFQI
ncbi:MAG TPA: hypothetical protein PK263_05505 [bacterium]|nr:hypothetical protein [bacterium]